MFQSVLILCENHYFLIDIRFTLFHKYRNTECLGFPLSLFLSLYETPLCGVLWKQCSFQGRMPFRASRGRMPFRASRTWSATWLLRPTKHWLMARNRGSCAYVRQVSETLVFYQSKETSCKTGTLIKTRHHLFWSFCIMCNYISGVTVNELATGYISSEARKANNNQVSHSKRLF